MKYIKQQTLLPLHDSALMDSIAQCYGHVAWEGLLSELIGGFLIIYTTSYYYYLPLLVGAERSSE